MWSKLPLSHHTCLPSSLPTVSHSGAIRMNIRLLFFFFGLFAFFFILFVWLVIFTAWTKDKVNKTLYLRFTHQHALTSKKIDEVGREFGFACSSANDQGGLSVVIVLDQAYTHSLPPSLTPSLLPSLTHSLSHSLTASSLTVCWLLVWFRCRFRLARRWETDHTMFRSPPEGPDGRPTLRQA